MSKKTKKILLSIPKVLLLCAIGITIFLPLLWMFFSAFKPPKDIIYDHAFPRKAPTRNETRPVLPQ